mmetsp:Transcript_15773/g.35064  ORF Transcript_15773/g.35064 Transcript_15773/m.35064 type:complete len:376 (+) Transcript_15773:741-1868(+)
MTGRRRTPEQKNRPRQLQSVEGLTATEVSPRPGAGHTPRSIDVSGLLRRCMHQFEDIMPYVGPEIKHLRPVVEAMQTALRQLEPGRSHSVPLKPASLPRAPRKPVALDPRHEKGVNEIFAFYARQSNDRGGGGSSRSQKGTFEAIAQRAASLTVAEWYKFCKDFQLFKNPLTKEQLTACFRYGSSGSRTLTIDTFKTALMEVARQLADRDGADHRTCWQPLAEFIGLEHRDIYRAKFSVLGNPFGSDQQSRSETPRGGRPPRPDSSARPRGLTPRREAPLPRVASSSRLTPRGENRDGLPPTKPRLLRPLNAGGDSLPRPSPGDLPPRPGGLRLLKPVRDPQPDEGLEARDQKVLDMLDRNQGRYSKYSGSPGAY